MTTMVLNTIKAKEQFSDIVNRVSHSKEHVILTRRGREIAALVPIDDLTLIMESQDKHDLRDAIESLREARKLGTIEFANLADVVNL